MRVQFKSREYFKEFVRDRYEAIESQNRVLSLGEVREDRIPWVIQGEFRFCRQIIWAKYSMGESIENLVEDYQQALGYMYQSWMALSRKAYKNGVYFNHYFGGYYDEMLEILSLGVLLHQSKETFITLAKIIDKDEVKDMLYEFILDTQIKRSPLVEESYTILQNMPREFKNLRMAVQEENKVKTAKLIDKYFTKDWIKRVYKEGGNFDISTDTGYCGYWNFYVAAISYLLDIDVSSFENNEYFPRDMYYYAKNHK